MKTTPRLYIGEADASVRYGFSRQWFQRARWVGIGPPFTKINNGNVLYPIESTDAWFESFGLKRSSSEELEKNENQT
jgi:hypothetical protein